MKSVADFKRKIKVGQLWSAINHNINDPKNFGIRKVSIVNTKNFAFHNPISGRDSWCGFPKASEAEFPDENTIDIYVAEHRSPWGDKELIPRTKILTYTFISEKE